MKQHYLIIFIILAIATIFSGCTDPNQEDTQDTITISGAFAIYPMMIVWTEEYQKLNTDVEFQISAGGAGKGMTDALSGMADVGMVSRDIYSQEEEKGIFHISVAKDAVVGTVNSDNPVIENLLIEGLTPSVLEDIYITGEINTWGQLAKIPAVTDKINVYTRADAAGAASVWAGYFGYNQEDLRGIGVSGDPGVAEAVRADRLSIGYNNINFAYDLKTGEPVNGITIVPLDINGNGKIDLEENFYKSRDELLKAIKSGLYPSPPARDLHLVTKGQFTGKTKDFILWILTDGQQYVAESGYLPLSDEQIKTEKEKILTIYQ